MSEHPSDDDLVQRSLAGESAAFALLVEKHQRLVYGVALSSARDAALAEDVAQEAFVEAWRDLRRLRDPSRAGAWIAGIARNLAQRVRRGGVRRQRREEALVTQPVATPLDGVLERETQVLVRDALAGMPAAYREALVLYYVHGESIAQVARGLGITEDVVKQRMSRGRRSMRAVLEQRVEGALEQLRPSKGFTVAVMVAVSSVVVRKASAASAAGKLVLGMNATKVSGVGAAILLAGAVTWYGVARHTPAAPREKVVAAASTTVAAEQPRARKLASPAARETMLHAIRSVRERTANATASSPTPPPTLAPTEPSEDLDRDYIRESVRALLPSITACYETALLAHPTLAGTLVVNFTIEGEPDVGGLVTESTIDAASSEITDPAMGACVQEAMFSLEIDPPTNGGVVKVTYPFSFAPGE